MSWLALMSMVKKKQGYQEANHTKSQNCPCLDLLSGIARLRCQVVFFVHFHCHSCEEQTLQDDTRIEPVNMYSEDHYYLLRQSPS